MSFVKCITEKLLNEEITEALAKRLIKKHNKLVESFKKKGTSIDQAQHSADKALNRELNIKVRKTLNKLKQVYKNEELMKKIKTAEDFSKFGDTIRGYGNGLIEHFNSVFVSRASKALNRSKVTGSYTFNTKTFRDAVRYALGDRNVEDSNSLELGKVIKDVLADLHALQDKAGSVMGRTENYFPQGVHSVDKIKGNKDEWINSLMDDLDIHKMIDDETGAPFTSVKLKETLEELYESMTAPNAKGFRKSGISTRREDARFFQFKSGEAFVNYNKRFGVGDDGLPMVLTDYIRNSSFDISLMKHMGPEPNSARNSLNQTVKGDIEPSYRLLYRLSRPRPHTAAEEVAGFIQQVFFRTADLGMASLAALGDVSFSLIAARSLRVPMIQHLSNHLNAIRGSKHIASIAEANEIYGLTLNTYMDDFARNAIMAGTKANTLATNMGAAFFRWNGLQHLTNGAKRAMSASVSNMIANTRKLKFESLDKHFREALEESGFTAADWSVFSKITPGEFQGKTFITVQDLIDHGQMSVAHKFRGFLHKLGEHVVNEPTTRNRAFLGGEFLGGTSSSKIAATTLFLYKSFPVSVVARYLIPAMRKLKQGDFFDAGMLAVHGLIIGSVVNQLVGLTRGEEMAKWDDPRLYYEGFIRSGVGGWLSDAFFVNPHDYGNQWVSALAGPGASFLNKMAQGTYDNVDRLIEGRDTQFAADYYKALRRRIPFGNLWYGKLLMDRFLFDSFYRYLDPESYYRSVDSERRRLSERDIDRWWGKE